MSKKYKEKSLKDWAKAFLFTFLILSSFAITIILFMVYLSRDLPSIEELKSFNPEQISKIISSDNQVIHKLQAVKKREVIKIDEVPDDLIIDSNVFIENSLFLKVSSSLCVFMYMIAQLNNYSYLIRRGNIRNIIYFILYLCAFKLAPWIWFYTNILKE